MHHKKLTKIIHDNLFIFEENELVGNVVVSSLLRDPNEVGHGMAMYPQS